MKQLRPEAGRLIARDAELGRRYRLMLTLRRRAAGLRDSSVLSDELVSCDIRARSGKCINCVCGNWRRTSTSVWKSESPKGRALPVTCTIHCYRVFRHSCYASRQVSIYWRHVRLTPVEH
jgi:hypothetical protein